MFAMTWENVDWALFFLFKVFQLAKQSQHPFLKKYSEEIKKVKLKLGWKSMS